MPTEIQVRIHNARDLRNPYWTRKPHPIAVVYVGKEKMGQTAPTADTIAPDWRMSKQPDKFTLTSRNNLVVKVYDWLYYRGKEEGKDKEKEKRYLGKLVLPGSIAIGIAHFGNKEPFTMKLLDDKDKQSGTILLALMPPDDPDDDGSPLWGVTTSKTLLEGAVAKQIAALMEAIPDDPKELDLARIGVILNNLMLLAQVEQSTGMRLNELKFLQDRDRIMEFMLQQQRQEENWQAQQW